MTSDKRGLEGPGHELRLEVLQERFRELDQQVARMPASRRFLPVEQKRRRWLHRPRAPKPYALLPILEPPGQSKAAEAVPPPARQRRKTGRGALFAVQVLGVMALSAAGATAVSLFPV